MDDVITLVKETLTGYDADGNEITEQSQRQVFCQVFSVGRSEFYEAATAGLHPEIVARLSDFADYEDEKLVLYNGQMYSVIKTYRDSGSMGRGQSRRGLGPNGIELTLQRKIGNE